MYFVDITIMNFAMMRQSQCDTRIICTPENVESERANRNSRYLAQRYQVDLKLDPRIFMSVCEVFVEL